MLPRMSDLNAENRLGITRMSTEAMVYILQHKLVRLAIRYSCGDVYGSQGIGQVRMVGPRVKNLKPGRAK